MNERENMLRNVRWVARIWSLISIVFVLVMFIGEGLVERTTVTATEWLLLLFFPVGVLVGLVLGWRWETLGGVIAIISMALFYIVEYVATGSLPGGPWFVLIAFPGIFFLAAGRLDREREHKLA